MMLPITRGTITTPFGEPRPVEGAKTHIHGALDVAGGNMQAIAPVSGTVRALVFLRSQTPWAKPDKDVIMALPCREYWYDIYGGIIELRADDGTYHLLTHFYASTLQKRFGRFEYIESKAETRTPTIALCSEPFHILEGGRLCEVGNAGYSTGAHIHWEVHPTIGITSYASRIDPTKLARVV